MTTPHTGVKHALMAVALMFVVEACATPVVSTLPGPAQAGSANVAPASNAGPAVAARPADVIIRIASPTPGAVLQTGPVKVSVSYAGPTLVPGTQAARLTDYHLHYFLDTDATPYIGTGVPIPSGRPDILHSAATEVTFDNVPPGDHTVTVVMGGSNHVSVDPPLVDQVAFVVQ